MRYADDEGIASRSSDELWRMEDDDRDSVFGFRAYGHLDQNGDHAAADYSWREGVAHHQCSRPGIQTNDRVCVLGWGCQRRQRTQHRDNAASSEGLGVLPLVQDGNL